MWINQDAWFHLGDFEEQTSIDYIFKKEGNGVYVFVIEGAFIVANEKLGKRDAVGVWNTNKISVEAQSGSRVLIVEVPMEF
jgi:redox-sensitive bicupin YhaK (pirin superfamily)